MHPRHRFCTFLLIALAGTSHANIVHRCRQFDGVIAYRDTGCLPEETLMSRHEALASTTQADPAAPPAARTARNPTRPGRTEHPRRTARAIDRIVAHECRFGEQRWIQAEACPAALATTGVRGSKPGKQRVDETRLTESQICEVLRSTSSAHSAGEGSARRAYGMNRLRQRHGC